IAIVLYLLVNLWWILPLVNSYGQMVGMIASSNPYNWLTSFSSYSSILHLFQLSGYTGWIGYNWGRPNFSYAPTLVYNPFFIILSFTPLILFGGALLLEYKNQ